MNKWTLVLVSSVVIVLLYWFLLRSSLIRSECAALVRENSNTAKSKGDSYSVDKANAQYGLCLGERGMKPEKIAQ